MVDWISISSVFIGIFVWWITGNPLGAVIIITLTDIIAYIPTFRKGYRRPFEETASLFGLDGIRALVSVFALEVFTLTTALYPLSVVITNGAFVTLLLVRREKSVRS